MARTGFRALFSDIGGVLGTNGWDTGVRETICDHLSLDREEIAARHRLMFDSFERGYLTFEEYIRRVFFASPRSFTPDDVRALAYAQSIAWPENIAFFRALKDANDLKLGLISNEGEGITQYRVEAFGLRAFADFMLISHFVHMRKPDPAIWQLGLDLVQLPARECIYVDDRGVFAECAADLGFAAIHHTGLQSTAERFRELGLAKPR